MVEYIVFYNNLMDIISYYREAEWDMLTRVISCVIDVIIPLFSNLEASAQQRVANKHETLNQCWVDFGPTW